MSPVLEAYDRALHATPAPSVQMAQRLSAIMKDNIAVGRRSPAEARDLLEQVYEHYASQRCVDEREAVADVVDIFDGWAPLKATV